MRAGNSRYFLFCFLIVTFFFLGCGKGKISIQNTPDANNVYVGFLPLKGSPYSVSCADFNSDGLLDAAVAVKYSGIYVFFNRYGHLDLSNPLIIRDVIQMPTGVAAGDFNGDGIPDIAAVSEKFVAIALNDGSGNFIHSSLLLPAPIYGFNIGAADFNNDGITDIVAVGAFDTDIYIYLSKGPLQFALNKITLISNPQFGEVFAKTLSVGDIDNDGYVDIIIPAELNTSVWLLKNTGSGFLPSILLTAASREEMVSYAVPLFYDAFSHTAYLAAVSGGAYNPELLILSVGKNGSADIVQRYKLQAGNPVHIDKIIAADKNTLDLVITHSSALTLAVFDRGNSTVSDRIILLKSASNCGGIMSSYNRDIDASIVVCRYSGDGIAIINIH